MTTFIEDGTCPECFGYTSCETVCVETGEEYTIPCSTDGTPVARAYFRMIELFSGARLYPAFGPQGSEGNWLVLAHVNNQFGQANMGIDGNRNLLVNVTDANITIVALHAREGNPNIYDEECGDRVLYGQTCMFIVNVGDEFYRMGVDASEIQAYLIPIKSWPQNPVTNINSSDVFTLYRGNIKDWETNTEPVTYGRPFIVQIGPQSANSVIKFLSTAENLTSGNCTANGNYKKLDIMLYNTDTGVLTNKSGVGAKRYDGLYPQDSDSTKSVKINTVYTCDTGYYSLWFTPQPATKSYDRCNVPTNSASNSLTWLWILLGIIGGIIIIGFLAIAFRRYDKKQQKEQNFTSELLLPNQSLPPANVPQTYPTLAVQTQLHGTYPYVVPPIALPYPALGKPNHLTSNPIPPKPSSVSVPNEQIVPKTPQNLGASFSKAGVSLE